MKASPRYEQLYQYAKISAENQLLMRELDEGRDGRFAFQPQIKEYPCEKTRLGFFERQQQDCREREFKAAKAQEANSTAALRRTMVPRVNSATSQRVVSAEINEGLPRTLRRSLPTARSDQTSPHVRS